MTHGNDNWSQSNLFIAAQIKHRYKEQKEQCLYFPFFSNHDHADLHTHSSKLITTLLPEPLVVSIPTLNIYFVLTFLGICAWTNHYHKHSIITKQDLSIKFVSLNRSQVSQIVLISILLCWTPLCQVSFHLQGVYSKEVKCMRLLWACLLTFEPSKGFYVATRSGVNYF